MSKFEVLGLAPNVLKVLATLGYEIPTPIQEKSIPILLQGQDLLAQAQTGTGKTAAFALPILSTLDIKLQQPQALILAPTRELAIQVAEAFHNYAKFCPGFHVLPIYGGQEFGPQLRALKRGVHVIVGTPGRVMDHLRRGTLVLEHLKMIVLDEADEMLKMGFIDDVKWILEQIPHQHQTALFSATMPASIRHIADRYLKHASLIQMKPSETSVKNIQQFFTVVTKGYKLETLTRFLEMEDFTAAIIFTRTKNDSAELAERLEARGYSAAAINGDMAQNAREKVIQRLKQGALDIIVATEVAARGLDIDRISYVINYDIPHDVDSYTHRIGRTGRAGRTGKALVFVAPREFRMLKEIQRVTKQEIKELKAPSFIQVEEKRLKKFAEKISHVIVQEDISYYRDFVKNVVARGEFNELDIAAAVTFIAHAKIKPSTAAPLDAPPPQQHHQPQQKKKKPHFHNKKKKR
jgi:ATP-dependent RNA helicase DeaD